MLIGPSGAKKFTPYAEYPGAYSKKSHVDCDCPVRRHFMIIITDVDTFTSDGRLNLLCSENKHGVEGDYE